MIGRRLLLCFSSIVPMITKKEYTTMLKTRSTISLCCFMNKEFVDVIRANSSVENLPMFSDNSLNRFLTTFIKTKINK